MGCFLGLKASNDAVIKNPAGKKYCINSTEIVNSTIKAIIKVGILAKITIPIRISLKGLNNIFDTGLYITVITAKSVPTCKITLNNRLGVCPKSFCTSIRCPLLLMGKNSVAPCKIPNNIPSITVKMFCSFVYKTQKVMYNVLW